MLAANQYNAVIRVSMTIKHISFKIFLIIPKDFTHLKSISLYYISSKILMDKNGVFKTSFKTG